MEYDVIILGGGPAGAAAAIYTGRKLMKTALITDGFGGQSVPSDDIQNWIGTVHISGADLAQALERHVREQKSVEVKIERVERVEKSDGGFGVTTNRGGYSGRTIIYTLGGKRRALGVPGEKTFEGKGVAYCSTCDAPLFGGMDVAVVGGGNSGLEAVMDLIPYARAIHIFVRRGELRGDQITQEKIARENKITIRYHTEIEEIRGTQTVTSVAWKNAATGESGELPVQGVFVEIGSAPNTDIVRGLVALNELGEIKVNHQTAETSVPGFFAAGDVTDERYKQNNIAAGNGVAAALSAYAYVKRVYAGA